MQLLKLVQSQVHVGVPLPWGVRDADGKLLLARGQVIDDDEHLAILLARGATVDAAEVRAAAAGAANAKAAEAALAARPATLFTEWEKLLWQLERVLKSREEPGFPDRVDALARHLIALIDRDGDVAIFLAVRQDVRRYAAYPLTHATQTAVIAYLMARRMGWEAPLGMTLVKAALTMNIATLALQGRLAAQGIAITEEQKVIVREHPRQGEAMLRQTGVTDEAWLEAVAHHHEVCDGSGYPDGVTEVSELAQALRLADVFMAKISPRAMRAALTVQQAERELLAGAATQPATQGMAMALIKEFGIYPPGEFVTLKNGEYAVVVRRSDQAAHPIASSITDRAGVPTTSTVKRDTSRAEFAITGTVADKTLVARVPPERLYGLAV